MYSYFAYLEYPITFRMASQEEVKNPNNSNTVQLPGTNKLSFSNLRKHNVITVSEVYNKACLVNWSGDALYHIAITFYWSIGDCVIEPLTLHVIYEVTTDTFFDTSWQFLKFQHVFE